MASPVISYPVPKRQVHTIWRTVRNPVPAAVADRLRRDRDHHSLYRPAWTAGAPCRPSRPRMQWTAWHRMKSQIRAAGDDCSH